MLDEIPIIGDIKSVHVYLFTVMYVVHCGGFEINLSQKQGIPPYSFAAAWLQCKL